METRLRLDILPQPDNYTCGPTCLHSIYRYFGDELPLEQVIHEVQDVEWGGTLDVLLASHALRRGYTAEIYTYNLQLFDPTWFEPGVPDLAARLQQQMQYKSDPRLQVATRAYVEFLQLGGNLRFEDLTAGLVRRYLNRGVPLITGLSATYLHRTMREYGPKMVDDDIRGVASGHFVVLCGYDKDSREVVVADPLESNPVSGSTYYQISIDRVICAILLGIVTYDSNLLIIEPRKARKHGRHADDYRRQQ